MHQENEKYSLTWHAYSDHLKSMMKELMVNDDFSDVTLVTEDKRQIMANISILRVCSPVFKDILKKEKNSNPIMYLRGVQYSELESILQYIYLGEATFYKERTDEFFALAKSLEIQELCKVETDTDDELDDQPSQSDPVNQTEQKREQSLGSDHLTMHAPHRRGEIVNANGKYECDKCHKEYSGISGLFHHKQSVHKGVKYPCDQCDYQGTSQGNLTKHILSKHEGIRYACDQCDYQARYQGDFKRHIQSKHEGFNYACDRCDYRSRYQSTLNIHIQSKHEGITYACGQCDYQATTKSSLAIHIQSRHEGIKYDCNQCDYQATQQSNLGKHIKRHHQ